MAESTPGSLRTAGPLTKSQVNKTGKTLRHWLRDSDSAEADFSGALRVLWAWRASHQYPLGKASMGLRSVVKTEGCRVEVSQRLKQIVTIITKLERQPSMGLATMQDIGGCRAVLDSIDELRRVERRLRRNRPPLNENDYVAHPRSSGYRGVHLIVCYDGRAIEVQLRTQVMHEWAIAVERFAGRTGDDLKSGRGPEPVLTWLRAVSEAMAAEEGGEIVDPAWMGYIGSLKEAALPLIRGGGRAR